MSTDSALTLYDGGHEAFPAILEAIEQAKESIFINMFIWREDTIGTRMAEAVLAAADRGVHVRIVKDRYGVVLEKAEECRLSLLHRTQTPIERLKSRALCAFYAPEAGKWKAEGKSPLYDRLISHENITLDADRFRADHSKFYLIDGEILFLGGVNIEDKENGADLRGRVYGDYMVRLAGREYVTAFLAEREGEAPAQNLPVRFPMNRKERSILGMEEHYLSLIENAEEELLIVMAYLSPLPRFLDAILRAHHRGCKVTVMIPSEANFQNDTNRRTVRRLLAKSGGGITVLLSKKMLHTKLILSEKAVSLGSTNITKKAFGQLDELNLALKMREDDPFTIALRASLARELAEAERPADYKKITYRPLVAFFEGLLV